MHLLHVLLLNVRTERERGRRRQSCGSAVLRFVLAVALLVSGDSQYLTRHHYTSSYINSFYLYHYHAVPSKIDRPSVLGPVAHRIRLACSLCNASRACDHCLAFLVGNLLQCDQMFVATVVFRSHDSMIAWADVSR